MFGLPEFVVIIGIIYAVLMFCLPFFVFAIRNESTRQRRILQKILQSIEAIEYKKSL